MSKASEILSGSVELQFPDVDISGAAGTAKLLALTVRFDRRYIDRRKDTLDSLYEPGALEKFVTTPVGKSMP